VLVDLGAHPVYLTQLFHGRLPDSVSATFGHVTGRPVEDNAAVVLSYPGGAVGVAEASFVTSGSVTAIELHGTRGSLVFGDTDGRLLLRSASTEDRWVEQPLPPAAPGPFARWVRHVRAGMRDEEILTAAAELTRIVEAAYRSARAGRVVPLSS
jgi:1,5-anhydro-D-fructose reductase (1,5-anhydro-D-mannitol-forming)